MQEFEVCWAEEQSRKAQTRLNEYEEKVAKEANDYVAGYAENLVGTVKVELQDDTLQRKAILDKEAAQAVKHEVANIEHELAARSANQNEEVDRTLLVRLEEQRREMTEKAVHAERIARESR